jgi:hypothetical protein
VTIAVGYIRLDQTGIDCEREKQAIHDTALRHGYDLAEMLVVDRDIYIPTLLLMQTIRRCSATLVISPTQDHVWTTRRGLTEVCHLMVLAPEQIWQRGHRWATYGAVEVS